MRLNFGDVDLIVEAHVRGLRRPRVAWTFGPVRHNDHPRPNHIHYVAPSLHRKEFTMALLDNQKVSFSVSGTDEADNPAPLTGTPTFSVDRPDLLELTDNGDGTGTVVAVGPLGTAVLSVADTETNGQQFSGSISIDVLAGDVTAVAIQLGAPEHK
jgi:hypothetical protein